MTPRATYSLIYAFIANCIGVVVMVVFFINNIAHLRHVAPMGSGQGSDWEVDELC